VDVITASNSWIGSATMVENEEQTEDRP